MSLYHPKLDKCPVCDRKLLEVGMRNHIVGTAKGELWRLHTKEGKERKHIDYISKNSILSGKKIIKL